MFHFKFRFYGFWLLVLIAGLPAFGGLIITPTFDSTITSDTNATNIEATINTVINRYESDFLDPIHVYITFQEMDSGLGESSFELYPKSYSSFLTQLAGDATTADDATALAHLPAGPNNPVTGTPTILIKSANAKALGFSPIPDGFSDGTVSFNASITNPGSNGVAGPYNLESVLEHEIDEVLGLGSTLGTEKTAPFDNYPSPEDLFRYDSTGTRSFTTDPTALSYFSIDGTNDLDQFDNSGAGDYGDWLKGISVAQVQDSFATAGVNPALGVELRALDVIGYNLNQVPEPASFFLFVSGLGALIAARRKLFI